MSANVPCCKEQQQEKITSCAAVAPAAPPTCIHRGLQGSHAVGHVVGANLAGQALHAVFPKPGGTPAPHSMHSMHSTNNVSSMHITTITAQTM
jgi:hypothetical protein